MASSDDCFAIRGFSALNIRVLLGCQDQIVQLEASLEKLDRHGMELPHDRGGCHSVREDEGTARGELMSELEAQLTRYSMNYIGLLSLRHPPF